MLDLTILVDYRGRFGSKSKESAFRSGFDLDVLRKSFYDLGVSLVFMNYSDVDFRADWSKRIVVYSSAEDSKGLYKSYIEDVVYGLDQAGAILIPHYRYLKAHNNKVFMEILRDVVFPNDRIVSFKFGNREDLLSAVSKVRLPSVIKSYEGAVSRNVRMCYSAEDLRKTSQKLMKSPDIVYNLKEIYRSYKRPPYVPESRYRKKAIVQNMIEGLGNDWKILVFGDKYYKLKRLNRKGDPRASGSGLFSFDREVDPELLSFARECYTRFNVPVASLDIAKDEQGCILIEFQFVTFGTKTLENSDHFYKIEDGNWRIFEEKPDLEKEFASSYVMYMKNNGLIV
jgi:glutathione synthase/RimK-type ligase-like ATP-grasp enzyme